MEAVKIRGPYIHKVSFHRVKQTGQIFQRTGINDEPVPVCLSIIHDEKILYAAYARSSYNLQKQSHIDCLCIPKAEVSCL